MPGTQNTRSRLLGGGSLPIFSVEMYAFRLVEIEADASDLPVIAIV